MSTQIIKTFFKDEIIQMISDVLNDRVLTSKYADSRSRLINTWLDEGLIDDHRKEAQKWKQHSIIEMLWIGIIERLRSFGFSKEMVKRIKEQLLFKLDDVDSLYPFLEFHMIRSAIYKEPYYLLVNVEGEANIVSYENYMLMLQAEETPGHMVLSLNQLFSSLIVKIDSSKYKFNDLFKLSSEELELLAFIKENDFQSINVIRRNGEIDRLEGVERVASQKRIIEILNEGDYQNIEIKQENGKVVCIHRTIKKKI